MLSVASLLFSCACITELSARDLGRIYTQHLHLTTSVVSSLPGFLFKLSPACLAVYLDLWYLGPERHWVFTFEPWGLWNTLRSGSHKFPILLPNSCVLFLLLCCFVLFFFSRLNSLLASAFGCFPRSLNSFCFFFKFSYVMAICRRIRVTTALLSHRA